MIRRHDNGQLAVGLAFAFTMVLAVFGLVYNSSMVTREKMKLQQTTDMAVLTGAHVQRVNLNYIRKLNEEIETAYDRIQTILLTGAFCTRLAGSLVQARIIVEGETGKLPGTCEDACEKHVAFWADFYVKLYTIRRSQLANEIINTVLKANGVASDRALDAFLSPKNLPLGLKRRLQERLGANLSLASVRSEYTTGQLEKELVIHDSFNQMPLFLPSEEPRIFKIVQPSLISIPLIYGSKCQLGPVPIVDFRQTSAKVVRDGNFTTAFLLAADYTPPNTIFEKRANLFLKHPDTRRPGPGYENFTDITGKKIRAFKVTDETKGTKKETIVSMALAKPFGGSFPTAGDITGFISHGSVGDEFTGAKLIGLADRAELEGFDLRLNGRIAAEGRAGGEPVFQEDFLH